MRKSHFAVLVASCAVAIGCTGTDGASPSAPLEVDVDPLDSRPVFSDTDETATTQTTDGATRQPANERTADVSSDGPTSVPTGDVTTASTTTSTTRTTGRGAGAGTGGATGEGAGSQPADPNTAGADNGSPVPGTTLPRVATPDVPACQAFEAFYAGYTDVVVVAAIASETATPGDTKTEQFEVVRYLDLADDLAALRTQLPSAVVQAFERVFRRMEAAPRLMTAAGFARTEFDGLIRNAEFGQADLPKDTRLETAADGLIAEFGPFLDVLELVETIGDDEAVNGTEWVSANCPDSAAEVNE